ncbi:MAG: phosphate ABC transporter substrate-binding/OmpA family protein [Nitrospinota bacterium]|nr:phosphate ABC transporter substrate-binding/OmpA family protein [Nitrospinota bacterium]
MNKHVKGAVTLILIGGALMIGFYYLSPVLSEKEQVKTSDAAYDKGVISIGMDNFIGYFPLCSPELKSRMLKAGYLLKCVDDQAAYDKRMEGLKNGDLNFAVGTVDSLLLTGPRHGFPGTIIAVLDESKGVDAIVAREDVVKSLDTLKSRKDVKIAVTPDSPSSHLLKAVGVHFDIPMLMKKSGGWKLDANGSADALEKLLSQEASVAVLWEPDVSKALSHKGIKKILGTEQTSKLIVDILMVNRKFSESNPEAVHALLSNYFKVLKHYKDNSSALVSELSSYARLDKDQVKTVLDGINWVNLHENATEWFGASGGGRSGSYGLYDTIESTIHILMDYGDFSSNPMPDGDPRRLTYSAPLLGMYAKGAAGAITTPSKQAGRAADSVARDFKPLSSAHWSKLRDVGTLKVRPIIFIRGSARLSLEGKEQLDKAAKSLKSYPDFRIKVEGHTNPRGDAEANRKLSKSRAEAVGQYLKVTYNVDPDRILTLGLGPDSPLPKRSGESQREYYERLSRVELHMMAEVY